MAPRQLEQADPKRIASALHAHGMMFFPKGGATVRQSGGAGADKVNNWKHKHSKGKRARFSERTDAEDDEESSDDGEGAAEVAVKRRIFLTLRRDRLGELKDYSDGDVWALSASGTFSDAIVVRSLWHRPTADGLLEVQY